MTNAHRDLATPEVWARSLERSRRRRELLPKARRENTRKKHMSAALATAVVAGPGAPLAAAQVSGDMSAAVAAESPANRAIEIREGGLPLRLGSQGELVAHVQDKLEIESDGIFGAETDAAVRRYQLSAGLDVDGIVGPNTWSSLFAKAGANGAAMGGSNVPPEVKQHVAERLERAGLRLAAQGNAGAGGQVDATTPTSPTTQGNSTLPTTQAPAGGSCGSSTISTPVRGTVTSNFGPRGGRNHDGIDIAAPTGTPVRAAACGTVSLAGQQSGYGNIVCITHTSQFSTCYAHLSRFGVTSGAQVQQGQVIGYVGCTGSCTGPHLHFETRVNGQAQDPRTYLSGGSIPGAQATVASASSTGTSSATGGSSTSTNQATVTQTGSGSTTATAPETVQVAPSASNATATSVTATAAVPAETTVEQVAVEPAAEQVALEAAAPAEVAAEPVALEAQVVAAPAEVAVEPVATEPVAPEPVAVEAAAPAEVAAEPVAVEAQVGAPADAAAAVAPAVDTAADSSVASGQGQGQGNLAATAATQ